MKKWTTLAAIAVLVLASPVFACGKEGHQTAGKEAGCAKGAQATADSGDTANAVDAAVVQVMRTLPRMSYRVGDFETGCAKTAAEKAGAEGQIQYVVAGKVYDCRGEALGKLATLLETEAENMMSVSYMVGEETYYCPKEAKSRADTLGTQVSYRLAGMNFQTTEEANAVAQAVTAAVAQLAAGGNQPEAKHAEPEPQANAGENQPVPNAGGNQPEAKAKGGCNKPCHKGEGQTASGKSGGCHKSGAQTASGKETCSHCKTESCCQEAQGRVAAAMSKLELIAETAVAARKS